MSSRGGIVSPTGRLSLVELRSSALLWLLFSGEVAASELAAGTWPPSSLRVGQSSGIPPRTAGNGIIDVPAGLTRDV